MRRLVGHLRMVRALTRKKLLSEMAYGAQFVGWFVAPFLFILPYIYQAIFFAGPGGRGTEAFSRLSGTTQYVAFIAIGAAMYHWVVNILWEIGFSFRDEREEGTLEQLWLTPSPRWLLVLGNSAANTLINSLTTLAILFLTQMAFGMRLCVDWALLITVCLLSWLALYGLGFLYAGLVMLLKDAQGVVSLGNELLMLVAGVTFPLSVLPGWIRGVARVTPLAWVLSTLRAVVIEGRSWAGLRTEITVLTAMAAVMPLAGSGLFTWFERLTRRRGDLGGY